MKVLIRRLIVGVAGVVVLLVAAPLAAALPIPNGSPGLFVAGFEGAQATPQRIDAASAPAHPFMADNGASNIHNDAYQTDAYATAGPLGRNMSVNSTLRISECASVTFTSAGLLETICVGLDRPRLVLMNPDTLAEIASFDLPARQLGSGGTDLFGVFTDFSGGGYFYLDHQDRAVVPTTTRRIQVIGTEKLLFGLITQFKVQRDYDVSAVVPSGDKLIAVMPDWSGRIWFVSLGGVVGNISPSNGAVNAVSTGERISNSFAVDETGGVFVVTDAALRRFDAGPGGAPQATWSEPYDNDGVQKSGQTQAGSGTTPTLMRGGLVAITDNDDPVKVVVMKRDASIVGPRLVCSEPVFAAGASSTDQSLIAAGDSLVAANNYGYDGLLSTSLGGSTTPGFAKVTVDPGAEDCTTDWVSGEIAPSAVPKVSLSTGLIYTYTKRPRADLEDPWYFTAIDFCTGATRFRKLAGLGIGYNNNYAPISLSPDGDAYVGTIGGLVRLRDSSPPAGAPANATPAC